MDYDQIAIIAAFLVIYTAAAGGFERSPIAGALVFTTFGLHWGHSAWALRF